MQIVIFGAPGAGKGTQAKILSKKFKIPHISTGDILRDAIQKDTDLGKLAKVIIDRGELVSDDIMGELVKETLKNIDYKKGFILDGFPRTVNQAEILVNLFNLLEIKNPYFLVLEAKDELIISRLTSRRVCSSCGEIANLHDIKDEKVCPKCGKINTLIKREDDDENVIKHRLDIYREQTQPVLEYNRDKYKIVSVNGTDPIEIIAKNIFEKLEAQT